MPSWPALPTPRQLADQHGLVLEKLGTSERLPSLLEAVQAVPDPRASHLVTQHAWLMLLGLVVCATLCGVCSVRGVIRWASGQGAGTLAALEVPDGAPERLPVTTTLTRALARVDADALDAASASSCRHTPPTHWPVSPETLPCCSWPLTARRYTEPVTARVCSCSCSASIRSTRA
ncbi:transposase family protein [Streptomyces caniscabiei]|uniref:transposase family protein n=1 Tax=Streptomyces caniscabiei TaxID=2746961 RepID=UPI0038F7937D